MFGNKKVQPAALPEAPLSIETMPTAFYGGKDPVIYSEDLSASPTERAMPKPPVARPPTPPVRPGVSSAPMPQQHKSKTMLFVIGGVVLLVAAGGAGWFFVGNTDTPAPEIVLAPPVIEPTQPIIEPEPVVVPAETPIASTTEETPTSLKPIPLNLPRILLNDSADNDADNLTNEEEELFGTDPEVLDADADGYFDGQEVFNLYNPTGFAPVKLIDSGLVKEYVNSVWQYRIYYPVGWEVGAVDSNNDQVLFSSVGGDYVEVRAMQKQGQETFAEWFARTATGENITDLQQAKNRFEESVWKRKDSLVAYIEQGTTVYVIVYHPMGDGPVAYRHVMQVMVQSFRPGKSIVALPEQAAIAAPVSQQASDETSSSTPVSPF